MFNAWNQHYRCSLANEFLEVLVDGILTSVDFSVPGFPVSCRSLVCLNRVCLSKRKCSLVIGVQEFEGWLVLKLNVFGIGNLYVVENIFYVELSQSTVTTFYIFFYSRYRCKFALNRTYSHSSSSCAASDVFACVFADENSSRISNHSFLHSSLIQHDVRNGTDFALLS